MKVHFVYINLLDCEAVTLAGHDKSLLKADIDKHFNEIDAGSLDKFCWPHHAHSFRIAEIDFGLDGRQEIETRSVTVEELRAYLAE
jgi:hypothetical protein